MSRSDRQEKAHGDEIVKCGCGLPMRQRDWSDHWRACRVGSSVPVTAEDRENLLAQEERKRQDDEAHKQWLDHQRQVSLAKSKGLVL